MNALVFLAGQVGQRDTGTIDAEQIGVRSISIPADLPLQLLDVLVLAVIIDGEPNEVGTEHTFEFKQVDGAGHIHAPVSTHQFTIRPNGFGFNFAANLPFIPGHGNSLFSVVCTLDGKPLKTLSVSVVRRSGPGGEVQLLG